MTFDNTHSNIVLVVEAQGNDHLERSPLTVTDRADLLQGTLDLLILKSLLTSSRHGWGISKRIRELSSDVLQINQGSLYPALYRLEERGLITSDWGISDEGRRAKFYSLTAAGRKQFVTEKAGWRRFSLAIEDVLGST